MLPICSNKLTETFPEYEPLDFPGIEAHVLREMRYETLLSSLLEMMYDRRWQSS